MPDPHALPEPDAAAREVSARLLERLRGEIDRAGGCLPFRRYMELALYAPGLGYYAAGSHKLGAGGDFITAPETSPLFARCLARQAAQVLEHLGGGDVLEFGAGSGALAVDLLPALESLGRLPGRYLILEPSPDLRARQQHAVAGLPDALRERVRWLHALPDAGTLRGVVLANEVLDAMPVDVFAWTPGGVREKGVTWDGHALAWAERPAGAELAAAVQRLWSETGGWPSGYTSERNPSLPAWVSAVSQTLAAGVILLIDYGYPRREYYSAERRQGTLMGYYRHRALTDPLILPGLVDITAHVDFTAVAEAGLAAGLEVAGYTTQAWFLIGAGLDAVFREAASEDPREQIALAGQVRQLTLPGEMGERFQAMALTRGVPVPLAGFAGRDLRERL
jgi:SAM-dependent MidA family methyltransferase